MLQTLCDFFLLLSTNKKTITPENLLTFYQFITKKIPQIEIQYPSLIINSLNYTRLNNPYGSSSNFNNNSLKYVQSMNIDIINEEVNETGNANESGTKSKYKHNMTTISSIQKDLLDLLYDMIDYFNEENLINFNENNKDILKNKIENKIKENNLKENANMDYKYSYENYYKKEIITKKIKKIETRNYILELIKKSNEGNNNKIFEINCKNFINFFNCKNKNKNRNAVILFVNIIRPIIKIYKENKKKNLLTNHNNYLNKPKTKSLARFPVKKVIINNFKNSCITRNSNINPSDNSRKKIINSGKFKPHHSNNININLNSIENDDICDDTIKCQTPKNISTIEDEKIITNNDNYQSNNNAVISNSGTEFKKINNDKMNIKKQNNIINSIKTKNNFKTFDNNILSNDYKKFQIQDENIQNNFKNNKNNINGTFDIKIKDHKNDSAIVDAKRSFKKSNGITGIKKISFISTKINNQPLGTANSENIFDVREFACLNSNNKKPTKEDNRIIEKNDNIPETEENTEKNEGNLCFIY